MAGFMGGQKFRQPLFQLSRIQTPNHAATHRDGHGLGLLRNDDGHSVRFLGHAQRSSVPGAQARVSHLLSQRQGAACRHEGLSLDDDSLVVQR